MILLLRYAIAATTAIAYLWGIWLILPFVKIQEGDSGKAYFQQRIMTRRGDQKDRYVPRWYAFPFFINVAVLAAIAWGAVWLSSKLLA